MSNKPLWRLIHDCAIRLTRAGKAPFTRADLIACVRVARPECEENSANPIIQGMTDNLKGGAPGARGRRLLHSVGRNRFVLARTNTAVDHASLSTEAKPKVSSVGAFTGDGLPTTEAELRDTLVGRLRRLFSTTTYTVEAEGVVPYTLPNGEKLGHASDILVTNRETGNRVSIELKYQSAVTDQFKCRAYDALHMKRQHGDSVLTVMLFAKSTTGISIRRAEAICYPFDRFYGRPIVEVLAKSGLQDLVSDLRQFLG